jgi:hypothetical protein
MRGMLSEVREVWGGFCAVEIGDDLIRRYDARRGDLLLVREDGWCRVLHGFVGASRA